MKMKRKPLFIFIITQYILKGMIVLDLKFLEKGTRFDIEVRSHRIENFKEESFRGEFFDMENDISFFIICERLFESFNDFAKDCYLKISFFSGPEVYSFNAKLDKILQKRGKNLIGATVASTLEKSSRRRAHRIEISLPITLHKIDESAPNKAGEPVCKGETLDISLEGICFLSNSKIKTEDSSHFVTEFSVTEADTFFLPVKLIKSGNSPMFAQYKHDYVFLFEFDSESGEKERLSLAMFNYKVKGRR